MSLDGEAKMFANFADLCQQLINCPLCTSKLRWYKKHDIQLWNSTSTRVAKYHFYTWCKCIDNYSVWILNRFLILWLREIFTTLETWSARWLEYHCPRNAADKLWIITTWLWNGLHLWIQIFSWPHVNCSELCSSPQQIMTWYLDYLVSFVQLTRHPE